MENDKKEIKDYWELIEQCAETPESIPKPGEWIAIDCGANVGEITESLLEHGGMVYAFEPNRVAYNILNERMSKNSHCICYNFAVSDKTEMTKLYLHKKLAGVEISCDETYTLHAKYSQGSSLKSDKRNVDKNNYQSVQAIRLCDFIKQVQEAPEAPGILMLKIDVEGAEVDILRDLLDTGIANMIPFIFVETHDQKVPSIAEGMAEIRNRIKDGQVHGLYKNIYLNWI